LDNSVLTDVITPNWNIGPFDPTFRNFREITLITTDHPV